MSKDRSKNNLRHYMPKTAEYAEAHGWDIKQRKKVVVLSKADRKVFTSISPSDGNADKQALRDLMRAEASIGESNASTEKTSA